MMRTNKPSYSRAIIVASRNHKKLPQSRDHILENSQEEVSKRPRIRTLSRDQATMMMRRRRTQTTAVYVASGGYNGYDFYGSNRKKDCSADYAGFKRATAVHIASGGNNGLDSYGSNRKEGGSADHVGFKRAAGLAVGFTLGTSASFSKRGQLPKWNKKNPFRPILALISVLLKNPLILLFLVFHQSCMSRPQLCNWSSNRILWWNPQYHDVLPPKTTLGHDLAPILALAMIVAHNKKQQTGLVVRSEPSSLDKTTDITMRNDTFSRQVVKEARVVFVRDATATTTRHMKDIRHSKRNPMVRIPSQQAVQTVAGRRMVWIKPIFRKVFWTNVVLLIHNKARPMFKAMSLYHRTLSRVGWRKVLGALTLVGRFLDAMASISNVVAMIPFGASAWWSWPLVVWKNGASLVVVGRQGRMRGPGVGWGSLLTMTARRQSPVALGRMPRALRQFSCFKLVMIVSKLSNSIAALHGLVRRA